MSEDMSTVSPNMMALYCGVVHALVNTGQFAAVILSLAFSPLNNRGSAGQLGRIESETRSAMRPVSEAERPKWELLNSRPLVKCAV